MARAIEAEGIPTVLVMMYRQVADAMRPPRVCLVRFPFGQPLGEPDNTAQQQVIVEDALHTLVHATEPGELNELPYHWRREDYSEILEQRGNILVSDVAMASDDD